MVLDETGPPDPDQTHLRETGILKDLRRIRKHFWFERQHLIRGANVLRMVFPPNVGAADVEGSEKAPLVFAAHGGQERHGSE